MPSRGDRVAARQAKLRQKRRRVKGAGQTFDAGPSSEEIAARPAPAEVEAPPRRAASAPAQPQPAGRSRRAAATDSAPLHYPYLAGELKRVGVVSLGIFVILAIATVFLG
jgi:hypothetical protein